MIVRLTQLWQYETCKCFRGETMFNKTSFVVLLSAVALVALTMGANVFSVPAAALISAMVFELVMWKRGTDRVRAAVAARRARRHLR